MTFAKILRIEDLNPQMSPTQLSKHISRPSLLHLHPLAFSIPAAPPQREPTGDITSIYHPVGQH